MNIDHLYEQFQEIFQTKEKPQVFFGPGRINLIGEHTDYNGGHVFPAAISFGTYALVRKRSDRLFRFFSLNFSEDGIMEHSIDHTVYDETLKWANFPRGMLHYIVERGYEINTGLDILYAGNIPNGAGLSSSASIEMVTGVILNDLFSLQLEAIELAKIGQEVENNYIGVNSGIMDQFAIVMGKKNHAIHLHAQSLVYEYAPIKLPNHSIIIMHTNKRRQLSDSKYNERQAECQQALKLLNKVKPIDYLSELTSEEFEQIKDIIDNPIIRKRAKHVIYENERTIQALHYLQDGDLSNFGRLMNQSHLSLQEDYEVTGVELDTLVHTAWDQEGVIGARMTGAGFGGCAIAIVEDEYIEVFQKNISKTYVDKIGYEPTFYKASIDHGARELVGK